MVQAPRRIDVHFVASSRPPSGLGEPAVPPAAAALANALYAATGRRYRRQPFDVFGPDPAARG
jgi:CO/xanthine dehydrogenase Mo-binding subunit